MSTGDERVIDLDVAAGAPDRRGRVGWRLWAGPRGSRAPGLVAVGLLLVGGALGAVGGASWQQQRQQRSAEQAASVTVFVPQAGASRLGVSGEQVFLEGGSLALVNSGPLPVALRDVHADQPGFELTSQARNRRLSPGLVTTIAIDVVAECAVVRQNEPVRVELTVSTPDGLLRQLSQPLPVTSFLPPTVLGGPCQTHRSETVSPPLPTAGD